MPVRSMVLALALGMALLAGGGLWLIADAAQRTPMLTGSAPIARSSDGGDPTGGYAVWDRNDDGEPVRWDPCSPIDIVLAPENAYADIEADLEEALDRLAAATGLELSLVGTTDERPHRTRPAYQPERYGPRWAPLLVAVADRAEAEDLPLRDVDRGVALPLAVGTDGARTFVTGQVILNGARGDLVAGFDDRADSWGATLLHELGHALGLDHVADETELLSTHPGTGSVELGIGDRAGLAAVGAELGCRPAPEPQPVEVLAPA